MPASRLLIAHQLETAISQSSRAITGWVLTPGRASTVSAGVTRMPVRRVSHALQRAEVWVGDGDR